MRCGEGGWTVGGVSGGELMRCCEVIGGHWMQCCGAVIDKEWMGFEF